MLQDGLWGSLPIVEQEERVADPAIVRIDWDIAANPTFINPLSEYNLQD